MIARKKGVEMRKGSELYDAAERDMPLRRDELAEVMRCSVETISNWVKQGMPCLYMGKVQKAQRGAKPMFRYKACMEWLERRESSQRGNIMAFQKIKR